MVSAVVSEETAVGSRFSGTDAFKLTYLEVGRGFLIWVFYGFNKIWFFVEIVVNCWFREIVGCGM